MPQEMSMSVFNFYNETVTNKLSPKTEKLSAYLGLSALLDVPLELVDDLVLLLVPVILNLDGLHIRSVLGFLQLLLQEQEQLTG